MLWVGGKDISGVYPEAFNSSYGVPLIYLVHWRRKCWRVWNNLYIHTAVWFLWELRDESMRSTTNISNILLLLSMIRSVVKSLQLSGGVAIPKARTTTHIHRTFSTRRSNIVMMPEGPGKSALVLFYHVNVCAQYIVLVIWVLWPTFAFV